MGYPYVVSVWGIRRHFDKNTVYLRHVVYSELFFARKNQNISRTKVSRLQFRFYRFLRFVGLSDPQLLRRMTGQFAPFCDNEEPINIVKSRTKPSELWIFTRRRVPLLAVFASDLFPIAPTEAACERSFSTKSAFTALSVHLWCAKMLNARCWFVWVLIRETFF